MQNKKESTAPAVDWLCEYCDNSKCVWRLIVFPVHSDALVRQLRVHTEPGCLYLHDSKADHDRLAELISRDTAIHMGPLCHASHPHVPLLQQMLIDIDVHGNDVPDIDQEDVLKFASVLVRFYGRAVVTRSSGLRGYHLWLGQPSAASFLERTIALNEFKTMRRAWNFDADITTELNAFMRLPVFADPVQGKDTIITVFDR